MPQPPLYRRSPHLVSYWSAGGLVLHNYATGLRTRAEPLAVELLHFFGQWKPLAALHAHLPHASARTLTRAALALERRSLLQRSDRPRPREEAMESWSAWNPAAGLLHFSTKDAPYVEHAEGERRLARAARPQPPPVGSRMTCEARFEPLPPARREGEFPEVLLARRTWRRFARAPLRRDELSTLLFLTFGVQGWMNTGASGLAPLKTSPSGGARHSIEAYVLARRVTGLAPGLYHYDAVRHGLERLARPGPAPQPRTYLPQQPWFAGAPALVLMTSVFPRVQWRYADARAYRVVLAEAGHLGQTFCLAATWLGLAPFCTMALADSAIERDLRLDGVTESVLYAAGVGKRPAGAPSAQAPR